MLGNLKTPGIGIVVAICWIIITSEAIFAQVPYSKEITLGTEHRNAGVIKFQAGRFLVIRENGSESAGLPDRVVCVLDESGEQVFFRDPHVDVPDAIRVGIHDVAINRSGILVIGGTAVSSSEQLASLLMVYDITSNKVRNIVRTTPVAPRSVSVDEQNNIWVLGPSNRKDNTTQDVDLIHKYAPDGRLIGHYLSASLFSRDGRSERLINQNVASLPQLYANLKGRVFVLLPGAGTLVEMNLEGEMLARTKIVTDELEGRWGPALAIQPNGSLLAIKTLPGTKDSFTIHRLTIATRGWVPLRVSRKGYPILSSNRPNEHFMFYRGVAGADDSFLILRDWMTGKVLWLPLR
jgi:hypothetical protein